MTDETLSPRDEILQAAVVLLEEGKEQFTEWDLTFRAWKINPERWGLPGYKNDYPDHKRVMTELMRRGERSLIGSGLMRRVRRNVYSLTEAGLATAGHLAGSPDMRKRAEYSLFDALKGYMDKKAYRQYLSDRQKPSIWLHVASFYRLSPSMEPDGAVSRLSQFERLLEQARETIRDSGEDSIRRKMTGGLSVTLKDIESLERFHEAMRSRFERQFTTLIGDGKR